MEMFLHAGADVMSKTQEKDRKQNYSTTTTATIRARTPANIILSIACLKLDNSQLFYVLSVFFLLEFCQDTFISFSKYENVHQKISFRRKLKLGNMVLFEKKVMSQWPFLREGKCFGGNIS